MKILVTGSAGLIGAHLCRYLVGKGYIVHGIDNLSGGYKENMPKEIFFHKSDLTDHKKVGQIMGKEKFEVVFHLAAYAAEGLSRYILRHNCNSNILASMNIINACVNTGVKRLVYTSSMAVYGDQKVPYTEDMVPQPDDPYGSSKYFVESVLRQTRNHFGLSYSVLRPHNVVGIYQNIWDKYRNVIGIWIRNIINNEPIVIFGDGLQTRAFSDIKFYMEPFEKMMLARESDTFNIGSDKFYTLKEVSERLVNVARKHGYEPKVEFKESRNEIKNAYCDHSKAKKMLGFEDATDLDATMESMLLWAKKQPNRKVEKFTYEIEKNMYSFWS